MQLQQSVPYELSGQRIDLVLAALFPDYSRSRHQGWIKQGFVLVDDQPCIKAREKLFEGQSVSINVVLEEQVADVPQLIQLNIVFEDDHLLIIDKPAGLVVHPGAGNQHGTMLNGLLYHCEALVNIPRAGIVHRIDKQTSGLLMVAKTIESHNHLVRQLQERSVNREYEAVVTGVMTGGGMVDEPISRHPVDRKRMSVHPTGKNAVTHYRVIERFRAHTWIKLKLETGRTHQIRVHMNHIHYPLLGDPVYGGRLRLPKEATPQLIEAIRGFNRQALHARRLGIQHPASGEYMEWESPLPEDMQYLLASLKQDTDYHRQEND